MCGFVTCRQPACPGPVAMTPNQGPDGTPAVALSACLPCQSSPTFASSCFGRQRGLLTLSPTTRTRTACRANSMSASTEFPVSRANNHVQSVYHDGVPPSARRSPSPVNGQVHHQMIKFCRRIILGERRPVSSNVDDHCTDFDLISSNPILAHRKTPSPGAMGQKTSSLWPRPKVSLTWALKSDLPIVANNAHGKPNAPEHKQSRKNSRGQVEFKQKTPIKTSEDNDESLRHEGTRSVSPTSSTSTGRMARRRRLRRPRVRSPRAKATFGYEIQDVDEFLTKASLDSPGNIPMVLSRPCVLYETHTGGPQREVSLPLGMVVNGVLKNRAWLYAQTPHGEEGYVPYACCLPLGILPAPSRQQPCWDTQTDIFPRPSGNRTDREKLKDETRSECGSRPTTNRKRTGRDSGERSVDSLYLRASRKPATRQTLLVIGTDYKGPDSSKLSVCKGDVVSLISSHLKDWFWVRDRSGKEGFIPAVVAGHGFL